MGTCDCIAPSDLDRYRVCDSGVFYVPDYITVLEENQILNNVKCAQLPWREVTDRKVLNLGGSVEKGVLLALPQPKWIKVVTDRLDKDTRIFGANGPNHVLLNYYERGAGIHNHQDGPIYHPGVCILSAGSSAVMNFRQKRAQGGFDERPSASLLLQPRSLLIFCDEAYHSFSHGIDRADEDVLGEDICNLKATGLQLGDVVERQGERVSLTVRRVLKTRKNLLRL